MRRMSWKQTRRPVSEQLIEQAVAAPASHHHPPLSTRTHPTPHKQGYAEQLGFSRTSHSESVVSGWTMTGYVCMHLFVSWFNFEQDH